MPQYEVRLLINTESNSPLEAVENLVKDIQQGHGYTYTVKDEGTGSCFSVDMDEQEGDEVIEITPEEYNNS